jgi:hypothetical protein
LAESVFLRGDFLFEFSSDWKFRLLSESGGQLRRAAADWHCFDCNRLFFLVVAACIWCAIPVVLASAIFPQPTGCRAQPVNFCFGADLNLFSQANRLILILGATGNHS